MKLLRKRGCLAVSEKAEIGKVQVRCVANKRGMRDKEIVWHGIKICVRPVLKFEETIEFIQDVMDAVLRKDGTFRPEMTDFAFRMCTVLRYTNASLHGDLEEQYFALYATDLYDTVKENICSDQLESIRQSINVLVSTIR